MQEQNSKSKQVLIESLTFNSNIASMWIDLIRDLLPTVNILHGKQPFCHVDEFCSLVMTLCKNKGHKQAIKHLKSLRLALQQYCLRQPITPLEFHKSYADGFPKSIRFLRPNLANRFSIMYSLSVFRLIEEFKCPPSMDVDTIIDSSKATKEIINEVVNFINSKPPILRVLPKKLGQPRLILSKKAGPNGPATYTSDLDLIALQRNRKLLDTIESKLILDGSMMLPSSTLSDMKNAGRDVDPDSEVNSKLIHSKLVFLADKACKTRVIAIEDWWSNVALSNLHAAFMKGLARLSSDMTYHQDKISSVIHGLNHELYTSDMTAFTDRFPIILEKEVIKAVYGDTIAEYWHTIISDRKFYHKNTDTYVQYNAGNPMGVLSSWPVSTFTHHVIKAWCASKLNIKNYQYLILGDDTLDTNRFVYNLYIDTISKLGVTISTAKCTVSNSGYAEFAKRLFTPEGEVTGLPVHLVSDLDNRPEQLLEVLRVCRLRGYDDEIIKPGVCTLIDRYPRVTRKLLASILSLPSTVLGTPPLFKEGDALFHRFIRIDSTECNTTNPDSVYTEEELVSFAKIANAYEFWRQVQDLIDPELDTHSSRAEIYNNHPLVYALHEQAKKYKSFSPGIPGEGDDFMEVNHEVQDEYYIYNQWLAGNYRELATLPTLSNFRSTSIGHKVTKCKYNVLSHLIRLTKGDCNISLMNCKRYKDIDLYNLAISNILPNSTEISLEWDMTEEDF